MSRLLMILLFLMISLWGCSDDPTPPEDLIEEEKYIPLLTELQMVRAYTDNSEADSLTVDSLTREVLSKYETSTEQFMRSHRYYEQFPEEQRDRTEQAIEQLQMDRVEEQDTSDTEED